MCQSTRASPAQITASGFFSANQYLDQYCVIVNWTLPREISVETIFIQKLIWKCRLQNVGHFVYVSLCHDDVTKWKHFPHYWSFVMGIYRSPVVSLQNGQVMRSLDVPFDVSLRKLLNKQSRNRWITMSLWSFHVNVMFKSVFIWQKVLPHGSTG